jgi:glutaminyl-peptide cyclotransferase
MRVSLVVVALTTLLLSLGRTPAASQAAPAALPIYGYTVTRALPHDSDAFTQGLEYVAGFFYEGTGLKGRSSIRKVKVDTGEVVQKRDVARAYFGEGITLFGGTLFQLTWQSGLAFTYDPVTFAPKGSFKYSGEGWGLTHDGTHLIMSDGTEYLRFLDPATFREVRRIRVTGVGAPLKNINELEYVNGEIFANVWMTDYIARIDPASGRVNGYIDLRGLLPVRERSADAVLNGIAYDAAGKRLFVTGKLWPRVFEIAITSKGQ